MAEVKDMVLSLKDNTKILEKSITKIKRLKEVEAHLRRKCKRYHKHVKGLQKGIRWRDELITELMQRLGYWNNTVELSSKDFKNLMEEIL